MPLRILVTGSNGYIGPVMVDTLLKQGHTVVGTDTDYFENSYLIGNLPKVPHIKCDIRDFAAKDLEGFDAIVHLAALSNDPIGDLNENWTWDINIGATVRLAQIAKEAGVKRFVYASSCSIYGTSGGDGAVTEAAPFDPVTPYAVSKVRCEAELLAMMDSNFAPVFMRNATAFGVAPRLRTDIVLNNLVAWAYTTGKVNILSDGTPWRPIVSVQDISTAVAAVLDAPLNTVAGEAFNIGLNSENFQIREIAELVRETVPNSTVSFGGAGNPDTRSYRVSFDKYANTFPKFPLQWTARQGALALYEAYREAGLTFEAFQSRTYVRLKQLKYLVDEHKVDDNLRWTA